MNKFIVSLLLMLGVSCSMLARSDEKVKVGDVLPAFEVYTDSGVTFSSSDRLGRPMVLSFFHTACLDCRRELPVLQRLYDRYREELSFLCVSRAENDSSVAAYWLRNRLSLPYAAQGDRAVFRLFASRGIPRVYIVDSTGRVMTVFCEKVSRRKLERAIKKVIYNNQSNKL